MNFDSTPISISIITVCFNSAATIADALDSVAMQTHQPVEHLVIDGASTDGTLAVVRAHGRRVARVVSEPDTGIYHAMNKGLMLAGGEVIGFLNSDDFCASPDVLAKVAEVFADPDVDACYGDLVYVRPNDTSVVVRYWRSSEFEAGAFRRAWCPPHPTFFVRKRVYDRLGGFDLQFRIAADMELMLRFLEVNRIRSRYLPMVLVKMRLGGTTNKSLGNVLKQNLEIWRALKLHGMRPALLLFLIGKLLSRGRQFIVNPA